MKNNPNDSLQQRLSTAAAGLHKFLQANNRKIVFAESCTGGKMAATMTEIAGVSSYFCGSAVTYREEAKTRWLSVDAAELKKHSAESTFATEAMAAGVMNATPESDYAISITGHLGPGVAEAIDGTIFVAVGRKRENSNSLVCHQFQLSSENRRDRQTEAACIALEFANKDLNSGKSGLPN